MQEVEFPRIYCINLKSSPHRKERMETRFAHHGLTEAVTFIDAVSKESPLVDFYAQDKSCSHQESNYCSKCRGGLACYASHLKAIRQFLQDGGDIGFICEDDILLHNNFVGKYVKIIRNLSEKVPLITFCYMMNGYDGCHWVGIYPDKQNLMTIDSVNTWGAQMYLLTKDYALEVLEYYDKPIKYIDGESGYPEAIIRQSKGYMTYPPLVIEDGIDSDRDPGDLEYHHHHFRYWGYENYSASEKEHISPLAKQQVVSLLN